MTTQKTRALSISFFSLAVVAACDDAPPDASSTSARDLPAVAQPEPTPQEPTIAATVEVAPPRAPTLHEQEALTHDAEGRDYLAEGDALLGDGRLGEAIIAFRHALSDDDGAPTWARLGRAYVDAGDTAHGVAALEMSLVKDGALVEPRRTLTEVALTQGDVVAARAHVEGLVAKDGDSAKTRYLAGKVYMKAEMWSEAVSAFQRALDLDPENAFAHNNLGYSALQIGRTDEAVRHLEHCLTIGPVKPYMLNNLGVAYERDGRRAEALAAYLRALELKPDYTNAAVNRARLTPSMSEDERTLASDFLDEMRRVPPGTTMAAVEGDTDRVLVID